MDVIVGCLFSRGLSPEEADLQYLKMAATKLVMFGVDAHPARVGRIASTTKPDVTCLNRV